MNLNQQDLKTLRDILVGAIDNCHRVLAGAADRGTLGGEAKSETTKRGHEAARAVPAAIAPKRFHTVKETGALLGLSRTTIYALIGQGRLKAIKIGTRTLISSADIDSLVEGERSSPQNVGRD